MVCNLFKVTAGCGSWDSNPDYLFRVQALNSDKFVLPGALGFLIGLQGMTCGSVGSIPS